MAINKDPGPEGRLDVAYAMCSNGDKSPGDMITYSRLQL